MDGVYSVGEVVRYLRDILDEDLVLGTIWISGEVSNLSHSSAGHTYFTLKDEECQLRCVLFRNAGRKHAKLLAHGAHVLTHGRIGIYESQGTIQLYVDLVQPEGVGALHARYEELLARLEEEGLFSPERKRALPPFPRRIGVVTSPQAAAFQDILRVLRGRFPIAEVVLAPTLVQGEEAPAQIVAAIEHLGSLGDIDVLIVARGGGSLEDLWAFNDERVARAIVASPVPIVSGVGHETDITIADHAADVRAPTPSAAALAVAPDGADLLAQVAACREEVRRTALEALRHRSSDLAAARRELALRSPERKLAQQRQRLDELQAIMRERVLHHIALKGERLRSRHTQLKLLDPLRTLDRGFALITDESGTIVRDAATLAPRDQIQIRLRDGSVPATVTGAPVAKGQLR